MKLFEYRNNEARRMYEVANAIENGEEPQDDPLPQKSKRWQYLYNHRDGEDIDWSKMPRIVLVSIFIKFLITNPVSTCREFRKAWKNNHA